MAPQLDERMASENERVVTHAKKSVRNVSEGAFLGDTYTY